ncbi:hypothetical protein BCR42DRAFT_489363 [Absidia repens]|uniref:WRKY domain-containing protein n=1 Tax=Absidia repens TaxID=90262 RepID=A0A1X2IN21_9FUNG|nr:hypothetical protein BCR42DRAFT_489363 [Absidia repens]
MDFCQSEPDFTKVPLYQPDHIAFLNKDQPPLFTGTEETIHPLTNTSVTTSSASSASSSWTPPPSSSSYDLQQVLLHYRSQPDLLQLILESKLQEDRRRTEEARLKAKELDLMLLQQHHQLNQQHQGSFTTTSLLSSAAATASTSASAAVVSSSTSSSSSSSSLPEQPHHHQPASIPMKRRDSSLFGNTDDLDDALFLQQMTNSLPESIDTQHHHPHESLSPSCAIPDFYQPNNNKELMISQPHSTQKPRKRREMQAITKLVETRENPYLDGHFWRNNGNTIQKKTGNKSVYFKCSNSTKGCPVNKTSTYSQETGEYLIKYRGEHLPECGKVQHIVEV